MLVLTRLKDQRIKIGSNIEVTIVDIRGDKVRLGVTAPPDIVVDREEVAERRANKATTARLDLVTPGT
ncbi:MAG TPA: carbon storage regulator [Verrucomicrobiales bacterium]|nr:carbon storage regulator [Verrucomicrobiales bacterium]